MNKISPFSRRCLFLLLLALVIATDGTAQGVEPRIVFASNRDGDWDIYSMDIRGNNLLQLTDHPADDRNPAGSPDGRRIAFGSERGGPRDLYVMGSDGNNVIRLTNNNFFEGRPSWSPDGTKIAFSEFRVGNWDIYAMDADGDSRTRLTQHKMDDLFPSWSPDGSKITFVYGGGGDFGSYHIYVMNADGKGRRNLTDDIIDLTLSYSPTWSPDGKKIVFSSRRILTLRDIYVMTAEGKRLKRLTKEEGFNKRPVYSPDGTRIAFESNRDGDYNVYLMDTNGRGTVKLSRTPPGTENRSPSWLPGALAVNPSGKLPTSWGELKRARNP